jgi:hypothetical protein
MEESNPGIRTSTSSDPIVEPVGSPNPPQHPSERYSRVVGVVCFFVYLF